MLLISLIPLLLMPVSQSSYSDRYKEAISNDVYNIDRQKYDELYRLCAANKCCRSSVRKMKKALGVPTTFKKGCDNGVKPSSVACPGSLMWCEYHKISDKPLPQ